MNFYVSFFVSGAVEAPAYLYVMFALDWFGRKRNICGTLVLGGMACLVSLLISKLDRMTFSDSILTPEFSPFQ